MLISSVKNSLTYRKLWSSDQLRYLGETVDRGKRIAGWWSRIRDKEISTGEYNDLLELRAEYVIQYDEKHGPNKSKKFLGKKKRTVPSVALELMFDMAKVDYRSKPVTSKQSDPARYAHGLKDTKSWIDQ